MPKPQEICEIEVDGQKYADWKTVNVQHYQTDPVSIFTLTVTEKKDLPPNWRLIQLRPGQIVTVRLAGIQTIYGYITQRNVAYDRDQHGVQITGKSRPVDLVKSSVMTETGKFDGYPWLPIAKAITAPFGIGVDTRGEIDNYKFKNCQVSPGETCFAFLDRLARMRNIVLGTNESGNLLAVGPHSAIAEDDLIEGKNILAARVLIQDEYIFKQYLAPTQQAGDDEVWGRPAASIMESLGGSAPRYSPHISPTEMPGDRYELKKRLEFEYRWREGTVIVAHITVQGWLRPAGNALWRVGMYVRVKSPMAMLDMVLGVRGVTFSQGPEGTLTTLELVAPWFLNGHLDLSGSNPSYAPQPGGN